MSDDATRNEQTSGAESDDADETAAAAVEAPEAEAAPEPAPAEGSARDEADAARGGSGSTSKADTSADHGADDEPATSTSTLTVTIDDRSIEAQPGQLVIDACEDAGTYVPRFCYHKRMSPVGMCRQCLVEIEGPRGPMMVVSCMTPVAEGQVVRTATDGVRRAQEGVLELLLANHPLDCPVCDKGGECPLQDQAFSHGPGESRYVEEKRHFEKPIPISDLVLLDRERCILCDRCTRFADEVAGDPLIQFTHRGNNTQVLTFPDEPFSSYFSGNTVQICPVGALTATAYRFKARPWDLAQAESTCTTCSVGCRMVVQSSRDELVRYQGVDSDPVNWGWLCDRGRFNFEAVVSEQRLGTPLVRGEGDALEATSWNAAMSVATQLVEEALAAGGPDGIAVLGGARGTNESAYAWAQLADACTAPHRDAQLGDGVPAELLDLPRATIDEAAAASTIVLLGPDLKEELPVLYLRLRHAAQRRTGRILEFSTVASGLTPYAWRSTRV
ncbi:MAG: 2Fe-2S iron-sulfur cluster-binding protein, partial [Actinomycetota bacterium]|nr:2Fe-2S iron-sulfur cluster-binding protein [Actinomycetota bacterium]